LTIIKIEHIISEIEHRGIMKTDNFDRYIPLETALKEAGFKVDEVEKQGKKTVVTVTRYVQNGENSSSRQYPSKNKGCEI
jgi:hypothetical protein